ncbi:MAG: hypothetical protein J7K26_03100 [Candidatus Aenigmarchaeota archaeon]|nr:hypothetical protein [Candidatus Aenigmarchaeota archaeon]
MSYHSNVNISSFGMCSHTKYGDVSTIVGNGHASSDDIECLRHMSEDLTGCVDRNNERVYQLLRG